jgi:hypothetical protein
MSTNSVNLFDSYDLTYLDQLHLYHENQLKSKLLTVKERQLIRAFISKCKKLQSMSDAERLVSIRNLRDEFQESYELLVRSNEITNCDPFRHTYEGAVLGGENVDSNDSVKKPILLKKFYMINL